jgi:2-polyprenyl-3-methyl-5-hydroxy-6-metoxy-1,4-benzoquinol methylase
VTFEPIKAVCPLCRADVNQPYFKNNAGEYVECCVCEMVFVLEQYHLNEQDEKARYDYHQNNPNDVHYRDFLSKLLNPMLKLLSKGDTGLDFGCGSGPTLSVMFAEQGYQMQLFDKYYANNLAVFNKKYDFITATEVWEHLSQPEAEIERLFAMLTNKGRLGVMTQMITSKVDFKHWYYKDDVTHICFFTKNTMRYLAKKYHYKVMLIADNVAIFTPNNI